MAPRNKQARRRCPACLDPARPIDSEQTFSFGDSAYTFEGCDSHLDQFMTDMFKWARMSRLVEATDGQSTIRRVTTGPVRAQRSGKRAYSILPEIPVHVVHAPADEDDSKVEPPVAQPVFDLSLPANHERWTFHKHARERMAERNVAEDDALWCAEHWDVARPSIKHPDCIVYKRGQIQVVANPVTFEILTVWHSRIDTDAAMNQELELQNAS